MAAVASRVDAQISGTVSGQIAVGSHIIQNNVDHGGIVYVAAPGETPTPRRRPLPVVLRGRRAPALLGREREVQEALDALAGAAPVEFVGPPGIGKTTVLKYLTHAAPESTAVDGVVYHDAHGEDVEDTLQFLYEAFWETTVPFKPTDAQLQHAMREIRALVVLDDLEASRRGVAQILDSLPAANPVLGSSRRSLWGGGCTSITLRGLDRDAAVELLIGELGRDLSDREREVALVIADAVDGQPLQLLQAAALVNDLGYGLAELADDLGRGSAPDELGRLLLGSLDDEQRRILEVLAALGGATLPADQLAELTGVHEAGPVIESLMRLGLVQAHSPRYSTAGAVATLTSGSDGFDPVIAEQASRAHLIRWVESRRHDPKAVVQEVQAILAVMATAARDREWGDVLRIGRAVEGPLLLTSRWGAWREVLDHELVAARRLGDRAAEGWALHQLGSRALGLGNRDAARAALTSALRIREDLGDRAGAEATRHNLDLLLGGHPTRLPGGRWGWPAAGWTPGLGIPFVLLLTVLGLGAGILIWPSNPRAVVQEGPAVNPLTVGPATIDFGSQTTGTSSPPRTVTASNGGSSDIQVRNLSVVGAGYRVERDGCSRAPLRPGGSCSVSVVFAPTRAGSEQATLTMATPGFEARAVTLRGAGTPAASAGELRLQPSTLDFGTVGRASRSTRSVSVLNAGRGQLQLGTVAIAGADRRDFVVSRNRCPEVLAPGSSCSVDVTFTPLAPTARVAELSIGAAGTSATSGSILTGRVVPPLPPEPPRPPAAPVIDLQVPASLVVPYGTVVDLRTTATVTPQQTLRFVTSGEPLGVEFVPTGPGTGAFRGTVLSAPGPMPITVVATAGPTIVQESFVLTVVPADVTLTWDQPLVAVVPGGSLVEEARLTQVTGTRGDPTKASVAFDVLPCVEFSPGPVPVSPSSRAVLRLDDVPLTPQRVRPRLVDSPHYRLVSAAPLTVVPVFGILNVSGDVASTLDVSNVPPVCSTGFAGA